jgi:quinol monooxygenase YgiN
VSIMSVTTFHATSGQEPLLLELMSEGRDRMMAAEGCESFHILRHDADPLALAFVQQWSSRETHDAAFGDRIVATGHLSKVLDTLDQPVVQTIYELIA